MTEYATHRDFALEMYATIESFTVSDFYQITICMRNNWLRRRVRIGKIRMKGKA